MGMKFYLDHDESRSVPLHAVRQAGTWNGHPIPMVTADQFRAFLAEWQEVDPDGEWNPEGVTVVTSNTGAVLIYSDAAASGDLSDEAEVWPAHTFTTDGPLYALDGWTWTL